MRTEAPPQYFFAMADVGDIKEYKLSEKLRDAGVSDNVRVVLVPMETGFLIRIENLTE
jgi:hypothetical protein